MRRRTSALLASLVLPAALPGSAAAEGDPIMPLSDVRAGMQCRGESVVRGTEIAQFDAEIVDVVAGDSAQAQPYLLVRVSGDAVDRTGLGPGFSGSPIRCPGEDGTPRIAGAISQSVGEYGGKVALATPIELVLGEPVDAPAATRRGAREVRRARPIAEPLALTGLSPALGRAVERAGRAVGRAITTAPARPRDADFPVQELRPGSAFSVGLSSGAIGSGAIGTVTYVDGDRLWGFGHPLDSVGARRLLLQDAYVYAVINNPVASSDLQTYKYAAPGHDLGTLSYDGISAVAGRLGQLPADRFPMTVTAKDEDTGRVRSARTTLASETSIGLPAGVSALSQVGPVAIAQLAYTTLGSSPVRQSGSMCLRIQLRERPRPLRFCNDYVGGGAGAAALGGGPLVADSSQAFSLLDGFRFGPLHVTSVDANLRVRRDLRQAFLLGVSGPRTVRRGTTATYVVRAQRVDGAKLTRRVRVPVPRGTPRGERRLVLTGTSADLGGSPADALETVLDLGGLFDDAETDEAGPRTVDALAKRVAAIHRKTGVAAAFQALEADDQAEQPTGPQVYEDPQLRLSGTAKLRMTIR